MKFPLMRNNILREDLDSVIEHLKQDDPILTHGPNVKAFEEEWSKWLGVKYSVFVNSGASANLLSMAIMKIRYPEGGEIIVPSLTWISDIASVIQNGFTPVFVDIDPYTLGMKDEDVLSKISSKTRAVFITHVQGFDALTDNLIAELKKRNIPLIEDVCESHGTTFRGCKVGNFGFASNFSFYFAHHMSTIEGGMISTNNEEFYQVCRALRSHGMTREMTSVCMKEAIIEANPDLNPDFIFLRPSHNFRSTEINAVIGLSQLPKLDNKNLERVENFNYFISKCFSNSCCDLEILQAHQALPISHHKHCSHLGFVEMP